MCFIQGLRLAAVSRRFIMAAMFLGLAGYAVAQNTIVVMNLQGAIMSTKEGQKAGQEMQTKYGPKQKSLEQQRDALVSLNTEAQNPATTPEKRAALQRDIEDKNRRFTREQQDAKDEFQADQQRLLVPISQRMQSVIAQYAKQKGYAIVMDDANGPVVFAASTVDITKDVVDLYDKTVSAAPAPTMTPVPPKPAAPGTAKPATPKP
jgi:Skp family chaperone for outer membrane proteins